MNMNKYINICEYVAITISPSPQHNLSVFEHIGKCYN